MKKLLEPGTISSGTLRDEDVIPALLDTADTVNMSREDRNRVRSLAADWRAHTNDNIDPAEIWSDLLDVLDSYAPPRHYVGSLEGDCAEIGVWEIDEEVWPLPREPFPD